MSKIACQICHTRRQRNIVNTRALSTPEDSYKCLECVLFKHAGKQYPGRYYGEHYTEVKKVLILSRLILPEVCSFRDSLGFYILDHMADIELRIKLKEAIMGRGSGSPRP